MRTIEVNVYKFEELSNEAKEVAIEQIRNTYYEWNDFANWATDDCSLFEPKQEELIELFGKEYKFPLIENTRKNIYFNTDRNWFLDCVDAIEITNDNQFLKWLGLTDEIINNEDFSFHIFNPNYRNADTTIDFDGFDSKFDEVISNAQDKFNEHIQDVLKRIEDSIDYRFSDEAIIEDIKANEYEFLSNGKIY